MALGWCYLAVSNHACPGYRVDQVRVSSIEGLTDPYRARFQSVQQKAEATRCSILSNMILQAWHSPFGQEMLKPGFCTQLGRQASAASKTNKQMEKQIEWESAGEGFQTQFCGAIRQKMADWLKPYPIWKDLGPSIAYEFHKVLSRSNTCRPGPVI